MEASAMFALADPDYYAPLKAAGRQGTVFAPSAPPEGWNGEAREGWTFWSRTDLRLATAGWKVHVAARPERAAAVLEKVAEHCFRQGVAFKHLTDMLTYNAMHAKHASRAQAGKFIAAYPPTTDVSRRLMECLAHALHGEEGPYILTDRRFRDSKVVFYRYGAYRGIDRVRPDGTRQALVPDAAGRLVEDVRGVAFHLPAGILDPFAETPGSANGSANGSASSSASGSASAAGSGDAASRINGLTFVAAIRHSNSGGAYRAVEESTGRTLFVKEARAHNGFTPGGTSAIDRLRREWRTLEALHEAAPGLAPEPVAYFREWEHEFMVTEFIDGTGLGRWTALNNPWVDRTARASHFAAYGERAEAVIAGVERALDRLHEAGYVFVDVSPNNVLVDAADRVRLIDFEAASPAGEPFEAMGTPGFFPPPERGGENPATYDDYGLRALALGVLFPFQHTAQRNPGALSLLRRDLEEHGPVPETLWRRMLPAYCSESTETADGDGPTDRLSRLAALRDGTASALRAMADPDHPARIYPTVAQGYASNTLGVCYGTAGVVHALHVSGYEVEPAVLGRLRREALDQAEQLAPGLSTGLAGIAWTLTEHGLCEEAAHLLDLAFRHPVLAQRATFAEGGAGVAMASAALFDRTGETRHLERALALAESLPAGNALTPLLGADDAVGFFHGRAGLAFALQQLAARTGDEAMLRRGLRLLHAELDRADDPGAAAMGFPVSAFDRRVMPYLFAGTAGIVHVATRYLGAVDDERLTEAMPRMLRQLDLRCTAYPGLCQGLAGLALALAEHGRLTGDTNSLERALGVASGLLKFGVPHETGIRFLGEGNLRYSAELWGGSAGVLLALSQILDPRPDPFFTLDTVTV